MDLKNHHILHYTGLLLALGMLFALPISAFTMARPSVQNNVVSNNVLGTQDENTVYIDGRLKINEAKRNIYEFEVLLQPEEYFTKNVEDKAGDRTVYVQNSPSEVYAKVTDGNLEILNLTENEVLVKGVLY